MPDITEVRQPLPSTIDTHLTQRQPKMTMHVSLTAQLRLWWHSCNITDHAVSQLANCCANTYHHDHCTHRGCSDCQLIYPAVPSTKSCKSLCVPPSLAQLHALNACLEWQCVMGLMLSMRARGHPQLSGTVKGSCPMLTCAD